MGLLGTIGALLIKFKTAGLLILTKGKLVLLGLTKLNTLLSMLVSIGFWLGALRLEVRARFRAIDLRAQGDGTCDCSGALWNSGQLT